MMKDLHRAYIGPTLPLQDFLRNTAWSGGNRFRANRVVCVCQGQFVLLGNEGHLVDLGSRLIPYNQKMTMTAMAMADMKTSAHLS